MLRLQPSQITLTQKDIDDYKQRSERGRGAVRLIGLPSFMDASNQEAGLPVLREGAQRSRDHAVVHVGAPFVPEPTEGRVVDLDNGTGDGMFRRDSVLSNEEISSSSDTSRQEQDSPKSTRSFVTPSPPTRRNAVHGRRNSAGGYSAAAAPSRRYRPRSLSDPCEAPVLSLRPTRPTGATSTVVSPASQFPSRAMTATTTAVQQQPCGGLSSVPENFGIGEIDHAQSSFPEASEMRARHHSLPEQYLWSPYSFPHSNSRRRSDVGGGRQSLTTSELQSTESPLEALSATLAGWSSSGWTAELPVRQSEEGGITQIVTGLEAWESLPQGVSSQTLSPSRTISDDELAHSSPGSTGRLNGQRQTFINGTMSRRATGTSRWSMHHPDRPLPTTLALGQGGRPRVGSLPHSSSVPIHRRMVANAEQENEHNMHNFERERQLQQERMQEDVGGVVETTPPPLGRLERRFLP